MPASQAFTISVLEHVGRISAPSDIRSTALKTRKCEREDEGKGLQSIDDVVKWLGETNPVLKENYEKAFRAKGIDGKMLAMLDESTLEEVGVTSKLHRKRILGAVEELSASRHKKAKAVKEEEKGEPHDVKKDVKKEATSNETAADDGVADEGEATEDAALAPVPKETRFTEVEICFSFDTTGSMFPCIGQVKNKIQELVDRLLRDVPHMKIALIAHGDYQDEDKTYLLKKCNFCCDSEVLKTWVDGVGATDGFDSDEAYEYVLREVKSLAWSPTCVRRALVMIGDASPHTIHNNKYDIDWRHECRDLAKMNIRVHGVHALGYSHSRNFYQEIARLTGGLYLELSQFSSIRDLILGVGYAENESMEQLHFLEKEVATEGRMNRPMRRAFRTLQGRDAAEDDDIPEGLTPVDEGRFQVLDIEERVPIQYFAQSQGLIFKAGKGFYEFTKPEKISLKKEIVLQKKSTGDFLTGAKARELLGVTAANAKTRLAPTALDEYRVFVQSTSYNRILIPGTKFLYEVDTDH
ncbi:hypothetical protein ACA910_000456 [Epithemia clementina (nom. ined.)]